MDSVILETPIPSLPPDIAPLAAPNHQAMLQESIDRMLLESQRGSRDFSDFRSVSSRLLHSSTDPPLEAIWLYAAAVHHDASASKKPLVAVRDLLQTLTACSASSGGLKCIALLAPAVFELYKCLREEEPRAGKKFNAQKEIVSLGEGVLSYISICCSKSADKRDCDTPLLPCFADLAKVWTMQSGDGLAGFFPLVSSEVLAQLGSGSCDVGYLAAVVVAEAFLMGLCLKVLSGGSRSDLQIWAVSSVTAFGNREFFEILLGLLLDPVLPVVPLLKSAEKDLVRDILYDVVILVDYSFLNSGVEEELAFAHARNLALTRLVVTHEAIRITWAKGNHAKAISFTNAFSSSCLPNGLIKMVVGYIGLERLVRPTASTPQAFLKWLVGLEEQGLRLFDDNITKLRNKFIFYEDVSRDKSSFSSDSKKTDGDVFFLDKQGDDAEEDRMDFFYAMDSLFRVAAQSLNPEANIGKKRKDMQNGEAHVKFVKYKIHDSSAKEYSTPSGVEAMSSGSEVDDPHSDQEMETEQ